MKLIIISGLSGSGKSIALHVLEDLNFYCIDNLPIRMLSSLADEIVQSGIENYAIGIDARNLTSELSQFPNIIKNLRSKGIDCEIFYLEATDATLLKRFSETRRRHPLSGRTVSNSEVPLNEAIAEERRLLEPIALEADLRLDTSQTNIHQLRDLITNRVESAKCSKLSIQFQSFGFKHGIPVDADFVFDVRCVPNPHWEPGLRALTGKDSEVVDYLEQHDMVNAMYLDIQQFLEKWIPKFEADNRSYMTIAIGCTGGQHRSVYMVERISKYFSSRRTGIVTRHRELN